MLGRRVCAPPCCFANALPFHDAGHLRSARTWSGTAHGTRHAGLRGTHPHPEGGHRAADRGKGPAWSGRHRHRQDRGIRAAVAAAHRSSEDRTHEAAGADPGAHARAGRAGVGSAAQVQQGHAHLGGAHLWRPGFPPTGDRAEARRACGGGHARPRAGSSAPRNPGPWRAADGGAGRGRRDAGHGLCRGSGTDPGGRARNAPDRAVQRHAAAAHRGHRRAPPEESHAHPDSARQGHQGQRAQGAADGLHRAARAQDRRAGSRAGSGITHACAHLLPHAPGCGRAGRPAGGSRLSRGGTARRHVAGRARSRDEEGARRHGGSAGGHRCGGARHRHRSPHARGQLRCARLARELCASHRSHGSRWPRGRGHHAGLAARTPPASQHRVAHQAEDRHQHRAHAARREGAPTGHDQGRHPRIAAGRRSGWLPRGGGDAGRRIRSHGSGRRGRAHGARSHQWRCGQRGRGAHSGHRKLRASAARVP